MLAGNLTGALLHVIERPDLRVLAVGCDIQLNTSLSSPFRVTAPGRIVLGQPLDFSPMGDAGNAGTYWRQGMRHPGPLAARAAFHLRHALELSALISTPEIKRDPIGPVVASIVAARVAALFRLLDPPAVTILQSETEKSRISTVESEAWPYWAKALEADAPPPADVLASIWAMLAALLPPDTLLPSPGQIDWPVLRGRLAAIWRLIGPAELLMAEGGDARLAIDAVTGLNHYGCSHRPRPWVITFASSTASSLSERGFAGGEAARLRLTRSITAGCLTATPEQAIRDILSELCDETRRFLADYYGLPDQEHVILSASGTDCELAALALSLHAPDHLPVSTILTAPEETGSGVPLAAQGCHFAADTALLQQVQRATPIEGFPALNGESQTALFNLPLRDEAGTVLDAAEIEQRCTALVEQETARGRRVLLHQLDLSKTGLLAPSEAALDALAAEFGQQLDIVVDACQARIMPERVSGWVARGRAVMITGSKFMTGPPFCGALLLPAAWRERLNAGNLPIGLKDYANQSEWPRCTAAAQLPDGFNHGLILRWHAAIAEMRALRDIPPAETKRRLSGFLQQIRTTIEAAPHLQFLAPRPLHRPALPDMWDDMATILSFLVRAPDHGGTDFLPLDLARSRQLYHWLNADLSDAFSEREPESRALARIQCHLGQPVPIPCPDVAGGVAGALRLSAGARLVSGEPSHEGMGTTARLARELSDGHRILAKIELILRNWARIEALAAIPTY